MAQRVGQGGPITLDATFRDGSGALIDPATPTISISDSAGVAFVTAAPPTRTSLGTYSYTVTIPLTGATGIWDARWRGTVNGAVVVADDVFEVVAAGVIAVGPVEQEVDTLVSVDELVGYMSNIKLDAGQYQAAEYVLEGVEAEIESYIGRPLKGGPQSEVAYASDGFVRLSATPVTSIESMSILGTAIAAESWQIAPGGVYLLMPYLNNPSLFISSGPSGMVTIGGINEELGLPITVNYHGGLPASALRALRIEILRIAAKEMTNRHDDALGVKGTERSSPPPVLPYGLDDDARERLSRFRRRVAV